MASSDEVLAFARRTPFPLDDFQLAACEAHLAAGNVLVAAPTGAGKTVVADFAVYLALSSPRDRVFYTTPIKALSNQKYHDLVAAYGEDQVGLLTGDVNVRPEARIVVMTTEVLRNMLYASPERLMDLRSVILDEVHFLGDRFRGPVWEEVIVQLPRAVSIVALSATVSNVDEFGAWLGQVRGSIEVVVSTYRPVPLDQHLLYGRALVDLLDEDGSPVREHELRHLGRPGRPDRARTVALLKRHDMLPAICFIFSRAGCDDAARGCALGGPELTDAAERREIARVVEERVVHLSPEDREALDVDAWRRGLELGYAAHHAGLLPDFKHVVEELFQRRLVKMVFATETLALGINMPARTVVIERLDKYNGMSRVPITPGEYTQLTGRAGRRGIDTEGHAVVLWRPRMDREHLAQLATGQSYPLRSQFVPTYNMAVNLLESHTRRETQEILERSFAQFQSDRSVVEDVEQIRRLDESMAGYASSMHCDRGDFAQYAKLRREKTDLERKLQSLPRGRRGQRERIERQVGALADRLRSHPCHACPDREQHARWAERWWRLNRKRRVLQKRISSSTGSIGRRFGQVVDILLALGYLDRDDDDLTPTPDGRRLRRIYGERDLLVAECLRSGVWDGLKPELLAAVVSTLVFEPRGDDEPEAPRLGNAFAEAWERTVRLWSRLDDLERGHGLDGTLDPHAGAAAVVRDWARGATLARTLTRSGMAAGDFIRLIRQVIDVIDQLTIVADEPLASAAREALERCRRGVVADDF